MSLPVPESLRKRESVRQMADDDTLVVKAVKLVRVDLNSHYYAEYTFKDGNAIAHFYRIGGGSFPMSFRGRLYGAFQRWYPQTELKIDWIGELQSWCVVVKDGGATPPHHEEIVEILKRVVS